MVLDDVRLQLSKVLVGIYVYRNDNHLTRLAISTETLLDAYQLMTLSKTVLAVDGHELEHYDFPRKLAEREVFPGIGID